MSKSLGNVVLVHDLLKEWPGEVIRFAMLSGHYRAPLDWTPDHLRGFIHDATAYHARSKMPSFRGVLDDARLDDLLAYLSLMASRKVSVPAEAGP